MNARATGGAPPPAVDQRLQVWIERIWPTHDSASPVRVTLGPAPDSHRVAEQYAVLPHRRAVRFLVPLGSRATTVASLRTYSAARAPVSRLIRRTLAYAGSAGLVGRLPRLVVSVDRRFPVRRWGEVLVVRHLAEALGRPDLLAFTAVRRINPNAKPTLELFDLSGAPVGYAKLGTTDATRELVRAEAAALAAVAGRLPSLRTPRLLTAGDWGDTALSVGAPLPLGMHRWTRGLEATSAALLEIAGSAGTTSGPLAGSVYAARLRAEIAALAGTELAPWLAGWLDDLERDPLPLQYGRAHGDWIPDNMGQVGEQLAVWDWEHSADDTPIGFDLLHWHFHHALVARNLPAAVAAVEAATAQLDLLGLPAAPRRLLASVYVLDLFVRRARLAEGGGGWNRKWYPAVVEVARRRGGE